MKGGIALQVLKHYLGLSDALLIERINTDWSMQLFCGIALLPGERIKDTDLPSHWRGYIGSHLDIDALQKELASYWQPYMKDTNVGMQDATCYESRIEYPTDVKLLWKCCQEVYVILQEARNKHGVR